MADRIMCPAAFLLGLTGGNVDQSYKATIGAWIFDILSRLPSDDRGGDAMDDGDGVDVPGSLDDTPKESVRYTIARACLMHTRSPMCVAPFVSMSTFVPTSGTDDGCVTSCMTMVEKLSRSDPELRDRLKPILTLKRSEPIGIVRTVSTLISFSHRLESRT